MYDLKEVLTETRKKLTYLTKEHDSLRTSFDSKVGLIIDRQNTNDVKRLEI